MNQSILECKSSSHSKWMTPHTNSLSGRSDYRYLPVFIKMTKVVAKILAAESVKILMYLDDWLVSAPSPSWTLRVLVQALAVSK